MTVTVRNVTKFVQIAGRPLPNVLSAEITEGLDQELGTATVIIPSPPPFLINKFDFITIIIGYSDTGQVLQRFSGYIILPQVNFYEPTITLQCEDVLALAKRFHPDEIIDMSGLTTSEVIETVLTTIGIPFDSPLPGSGKVVAESDYYWSLLMNGLELIKGVDEMDGSRDVDGNVSAWRTVADSSGFVRRIFISEIPGDNYSYTFEEGVNILEGTLDFEETDPSTQVTVIGDDVLSAESIDDNDVILASPYWRKYKALKVQLTNPDTLSTQETTSRILASLSKDVTHISLTTQEDMFIIPPMTVRLIGAHWLLDSGVNMWVQSVTTRVDDSGAFAQQLVLVGTLRLNLIGKTNPFTGKPVPVEAGGPRPPVTTQPPGNNNVLATLGLPVIVQETVLLGGVSTKMYVVTMTDLSTSTQGTIASRAWTATGPGVITTSGTGVQFTTAFTSLAGAIITLAVTDSNGSTKTLTRDLSTSIIPTRSEKLYVGTTTQAWAFDGLVWRSYTPSNASPITAVSHGPHWAAGDLHLASTDDLATAAIETTPFGAGAAIRAIWREPDVLSPILDGASLGGAAKVAKSATGAGAWTVTADPPTGTDVRATMVSRFNFAQFHILTDTGYYVSDTAGGAWRLIRLGDFVDFQFSAIGRNIVVTADGHLERAEDGTRFTFAGSANPPAPILCCTVNIKNDTQYALGSDGKTWVTITPGGWDMEQRVSIPSGTPQIRGMYRSGLVVDKIYFAAGSGGLWETVNGFRAGGYLQLLDT